MSLAPALASSLRIAPGYPVSACTQVSATSITSPTYGASPTQKLFAFVGGFTATFDASSLSNSFSGGDVIWSLITSGTTTSESWGIYQGRVVGIPVGTTTCSGGGLATSVYLCILGYENCTGYGWFGNGSGTGTTPTFTVTPQAAGSMILAMVNDGHGSSLRTSSSTQIIDTKTNPGDNDSYWLEAPQEWFKAPGTYTYGAASPAPSAQFAYVAIEIQANCCAPPTEFPYAILGASFAPEAPPRPFRPMKWGDPNPVSRFRSKPLGDPVPPPPDNPPADPVSRGPFRKVGRFPVGRFRSSIPAVLPVVGGTTFFQNVDGTLSSSGALQLQTQKVLGGTLTSSGALVKQVGKVLAGTLTSAGALAKQLQRALSGTLTSSGALLKQIGKVLGGTLTSSGALTVIKVALRSFVGTLSMSGTLIKQVQKPLGGTLTSAGALLKLTSKFFAGTLTSSGSLLKQVGKVLSGTLTSSGALTVIKVALRSFAGTLTTSGTLVRQTGKALGGTLASNGTLVRQVRKGLTGVLAPVGVLTKLIPRAFTGTLSMAGSAVVQLLNAVTQLGRALFGRAGGGGLTGRSDGVLRGRGDPGALTGKQDGTLTGKSDSTPLKGEVD